jgi:hypothetical protein
MGERFVLDGVNRRRLHGSDGDDVVRGSAESPWVWNGRRGLIELRRGDDLIEGGRFVRLDGQTSLGRGRDTVIGRDAITLLAVDAFQGNLGLGAGADRLQVPAGTLRVGEDSTVTLGDGEDRIEAVAVQLSGATIETGRGADRLELGDGSLSLGIDLGVLTMGRGRDRLIARGGMRLADGTCAMGRGDDHVDVGSGGLNHWDSPANLLDLGAGDDRCIGFATRPDQGAAAVPGAGLRGGGGRDTLVLPTGVYTVRAEEIRTADSLLPIAGINRLEGILGGSFRFAPGILTVNAAGVAAFVPAA